LAISQKPPAVPAFLQIWEFSSTVPNKDVWGVFCAYQLPIASVAAAFAIAAYSDEPLCPETALSSALATVKGVGFSGNRSDFQFPLAPETASSAKNLKACRTLGSRWIESNLLRTLSRV